MGALQDDDNDILLPSKDTYKYSFGYKNGDLSLIIVEEMDTHILQDISPASIFILDVQGLVLEPSFYTNYDGVQYA